MGTEQGSDAAKNAAGGDEVLLGEAARRAAALVRSGMTIGMGTGRAASLTLRLLAQRVQQEGLRVRGVSTSERTAALARELGLEMTTLEEAPRLDLDLDGADEVDPRLNLVKGLGGALLREKIVAQASDQLVIVVDESKLVPRLGAHAPLPVEVAPFGWQSTARALRGLGLQPALRLAQGAPFRTDSGNYILDCWPTGDALADVIALSGAIKGLTGVVEHGLFVGMATQVIVATAAGTARVLYREG